jgi:hypothetical protein
MPRCPSACTIARTSFPQPRTNTRTNTDINLSSASRILLCAALIDSTTNPDRNHRIDRRHQAAARARSGACHHTPAESLIIILSLLQQPYHLYRCSSSLFTYIILLLPVFTTHTLPSSFLLHYTPHLYISKMVAPPDGGQLERVESYQVGTDARGAPPCHHRFQL